MRSCLTVFLAAIILIGIGVWAGLFSSGQIEAGLCAGEPLRVMIGLLVAAISTLALAIILVYLVNEQMLSSRMGGGRMILIASLVMAFALAGITLYSYQRAETSCTMPNELFSALAPACQGTAVPQAGETDNDTAKPLHLVVLGENGEQNAWTNGAQENWTALSLDDVELLVCVSEPTTSAEGACDAVLVGKVSRYTQEIKAVLVEPRTATILKETTLRGLAPDCPANTTLVTRLVGEVTFDQLKDWVELQISDLGISATNFVRPTATIVPTKISTPAPTQTPEATPTTVPFGDTKTSVRVRSGPGTDQSILTGLPTGETVQILGANADRTWLQVNLPDGSTGWIFAELLILNVSLDQIPVIP